MLTRQWQQEQLPAQAKNGGLACLMMRQQGWACWYDILSAAPAPIDGLGSAVAAAARAPCAFSYRPKLPLSVPLRRPQFFKHKDRSMRLSPMLHMS